MLVVSNYILEKNCKQIFVTLWHLNTALTLKYKKHKILGAEGKDMFQRVAIRAHDKSVWRKSKEKLIMSKWSPKISFIVSL